MANIGQAVFRFCGALVLAAGATLIDHSRLGNDTVSARVATVPVVVAAKDVPEGVLLDASALAVAFWPAGSQPEGAFDRAGAVYGRVSRVPIFKGEPIVPRRLAPHGTSAGLEVRINPGKRAMSIRINDVAGLTELVHPNSRVDILVVTDAGERGRVAELFMENMRVLAIVATPHAAIATLEVTPEEGERLAIASARGQIQLLLRGYGDPDGVSGWRAVPLPRMIRADTATVRVIRSYSRRGMQLQVDSTVPRLPRRERPSP